MGSVACTFNGHTYYNNGWAYKYITTVTGTGHPAYGKDYYGHNRCIVLKITTPTIPSNAVNCKLQIKIPLYRYTGGYDTMYYGITTTAPTYSEGGGSNGGVSLPTAISSWYIWTGSSYSTVTLNTIAQTFSSSTTYYLWMWSDTPSASNTNMGYYGHGGSVDKITANITYDEVEYYAPSVSLSGNSGFYGGATLTISNNSSYPYIYIGTSTSGLFWRKATSGTSANLDKDTSSTSKTIYVVRTNYDMGTSMTAPSTYTTFSVPRFACTIYNMSSSSKIYSGNSGSISISYSGLTLQGLASSSSTTSVSYSANWSNGASLNGKTWYAVYKGSTTVTYYRGSSTAYSTSGTRYGYGTGSYTSWSVTEPTRTCLSNSSYSFQGWSTSSSSTSVNYSSLTNARIGGYTTLYGVYKLAATSTDSTKYFYRGSSAKQSVTQTQTISAGYYYGKGSHTGRTTSYSYGSISTTCLSNSNYSLQGWTTGSGTSTSYAASVDGLKSAWQAGNSTVYGVYKWSYNITYNSQNPSGSGTSSATRYYYYTGTSGGNWPTEPSLTYKYHTLLGWSTSSTGIPSTWTSLTRSGAKTLYAIWKVDNQIYYGINGSWKLCNVYYGVNGSWKPISLIKFGSGGNWLSS